MICKKDDERAITERAQGYVSKGELAKALLEFKKLAEANPEDLQVQLQIGDLLRKLGREPEALTRYKYVLSEYVKKGYLLQSIALAKLILKLDPEDGETLQVLKDLSSRKEALFSQKDVKKTGIPLLFADLSEEEFHQVLTRLRSYQLGKGSLVCKEGEKEESIYIITQGKVGIYKYNIKEKKEVLLTVLKDGDFFGEFSFFSHQRRSASAWALTDVALLEITQGDFDEVQKIYPNISEVLLTLYKKRIVDTILALSPPFNALRHRDRKRLVERFSHQVMNPNTLVIREGTPPSFLYIIKVGRVEVFTEEEGKKVTLGHLTAGDIFGEISLILERDHTASVRTVTRTELLAASKEDVDEIVGYYPKIRETLKRYSRERLEEARDVILISGDVGEKWI
ncbi:MAG: cyclic nucleotide-binding domain-containing protein [Deltaproteobacteria bacterium]|nr:cyclic nucleotide-binding domain-containing protein [Deltaproteobacteria bacterium]